MSARVPMLGTGAEQAVVAVKDRNGSGAKGLPHCADGTAATTGDNAGGRTAVKSAKLFPVIKRQVWEAYKRVRAIFNYIEVFYNRAWHYSHLGGVSPEAFEQASS